MAKKPKDKAHFTKLVFETGGSSASPTTTGVSAGTSSTRYGKPYALSAVAVPYGHPAPPAAGTSTLLVSSSLPGRAVGAAAHATLRTSGHNYRFFGAEASLNVYKVPKFSGDL